MEPASGEQSADGNWEDLAAAATKARARFAVKLAPGPAEPPAAYGKDELLAYARDAAASKQPPLPPSYAGHAPAPYYPQAAAPPQPYAQPAALPSYGFAAPQPPFPVSNGGAPFAFAPQLPFQAATTPYAGATSLQAAIQAAAQAAAQAAVGYIPSPGGVGRVFIPPSQQAAGPSSGFVQGPGGVGRVFIPPVQIKPAEAPSAPREAVERAPRKRFCDDEDEPQQREYRDELAEKPRRKFRDEEDAPKPAEPKPAELQPAEKSRRRFREEQDDTPAEREAPAQPAPARRRFSEDEPNEPAVARGSAGSQAKRRFCEEEPEAKRRFCEEEPEARLPPPSAAEAGPTRGSAAAAAAASRPPDENEMAKWGLLSNVAPGSQQFPTGAGADSESHAGLGSGGGAYFYDMPAPQLSGLNKYLPQAELSRLIASAHGSASAAGGQEGGRLESSNLGHQMLSRMGWEEGRGLQPAMAREGIAEPIHAGDVQKRGERPGLGMATGEFAPSRAASCNLALHYARACAVTCGPACALPTRGAARPHPADARLTRVPRVMCVLWRALPLLCICVRVPRACPASAALLALAPPLRLGAMPLALTRSARSPDERRAAGRRWGGRRRDSR
ncbi:hypothetical protein T492DRAFT_946971 [Pavlovales sp. CCMP2436]|nr:hypothetical protein T492DRAFT_946971 [Pavlovales sp. CCMP2436]